MKGLGGRGVIIVPSNVTLKRSDETKFLFLIGNLRQNFSSKLKFCNKLYFKRLCKDIVLLQGDEFVLFQF